MPEVLVPSLFRFQYTVDELLLLLVLATGTAIGIRKGLPLWSYTWVVLTVVSIVAFLSSFLPSVFYDVIDFRPVGLGWLFMGTHLFGSLLVLAFAASRTFLGLRYAFFVAGIYLAGSAVSPYIMGPAFGWSTFQLAATNTLSILIAFIMLAVIVAMVIRFLYGDERIQRRSVYVLAAVALLDPVLTGLVLGLGSVGIGSIVNVGGLFGTLQIVRWPYVGMVLFITWALALLFIRLRREEVSGPTSSGAVDG